MIDIQDVLRNVPHFETFCSVQKLHSLVERLRADSRFSIAEAGVSVNGLPIHHVRYGTGSVKALFVAFPHCHEPIGGLTVFSLMTMLHEGNRALKEANVEWHIIPCIDPDGALLNEGWSQNQFAFENYMKNFHEQPCPDQVDMSFPVKYEELEWNQPATEAKVLQGILERIRPDFFFSLHDARACGGAFFFINSRVDGRYRAELIDLLRQHRIPLRVGGVMELCTRIEDGIYELPSLKRGYDRVRSKTASFRQVLPHGTSSTEYLEDISPTSVTFVAELSYVRYPIGRLGNYTDANLRQLMLRIDADNKFVFTAILEEWDKVKEDLDATSPFYRKVLLGLISEREGLCEGVPQSIATRDILFNPIYNRAVTDTYRIDAYLAAAGRLGFLCQSYEFVRLLKDSNQTPRVRQAVLRVDKIFDDALAEIAENIDLSTLEPIDCDTLARVQLGSGLIALNSVVEANN